MRPYEDNDRVGYRLLLLRLLALIQFLLNGVEIDSLVR